MSRADQLELLRVTLDELENGLAEGRSPVEELLLAYLGGDERELWEIFTSQFDLDRRFDRQLLDRILFRRNEIMAERIGQALRERPDEVLFFAVGTAHWLLGDGILSLLAERGVATRRIGAADTALVREALGVAAGAR
jgi:uncharacterized protein YbaP (TraB family)